MLNCGQNSVIMVLNEVVAQLNTLFKIKTAEDFDNVGLLCGRADMEVSGILVCHDALEKVIDEANEQNKNLIVVFHPIIFSGLKSITGKNYVERAVLKAIENKIAIYAVHTAFDNDYNGVNYGICEALKLENQHILMPKPNQIKKLDVYVPEEQAENLRNALFEAGAGSIGFYEDCSFSISGEGTFKPKMGANPFLGNINEREYVSENLISVVFENHLENQILKAMRIAHPYEEIAYQIYSLDNTSNYTGLGRFGELPEALSEDEFLQKVKEIFNVPIIRHSHLRGKKVKKVGVLGGSGASGISAAKAVGCDAYLTGDLKYHDFFQAEGKILLCDIGHFESEQFVCQQLFDLLSEKFPKFAISKSILDTNPVNYFL